MKQSQGLEEVLDTKLIEALHGKEGLFSMAVTGGGASAISALLAVPGASRTLLAATVPYHERELARYLGAPPAQACSSHTAQLLAMASWQRALELKLTTPVIGLGCSAALATDRVRRGEDRCFVAVQSIKETIVAAVVFDKHGRTRAEEEQLCTTLILGLMAQCLDIDADPVRDFRITDKLSLQQQKAGESWQALFLGKRHQTAERAGKLLFPGAFNPMHHGHQDMLTYAQHKTGKAGMLEISVANVDKPSINYLEMQRRADGIGDLPVTFTNAPTFVEKARIFPGVTFIVGVDTVMRVIDSHYYQDSEAQRDSAIAEMCQLGVRFLVFGRETEAGFLSLDDLTLPQNLRQICDGVSESDFRSDISSTALRLQPQSV